MIDPGAPVASGDGGDPAEAGATVRRAPAGQVAVALRRGRPLAPMQRSLWMSQRRHPEHPVQNMALLSHLDGPVDPDRLASAFATVVAACDVLRTTIVDHDGTPAVQLSSVPPGSEVVHLARADVAAWAAERARRPIDTTRCGYDSAIVVHDDGTVSWYLALHHIVTDATSSALVFAATAAAYEGHEVQLDSYYSWISSLSGRSGARLDRAVSHWRERRPAPGVGRLYRSVHAPSPRSERLPLPLDGELLDRAQARLASDYATMSDDLAWTNLLVTMAAVYLHRTARVDRFSIGVPVHNRTDATTRTLIGPLMEVFPVDVVIEADDTFRTLHRRVGRSLMSTLRHAIAGTSPAADYEAVVNVIPRAGLGAFGQVPATTTWIHSGAADASHLFRLQLTGYGSDERELLLDLNVAAADRHHRERAGAHAMTVLRRMLADPDLRVGEGSIATPDELDQIRAWETVDDLPGETPGIVEQLRAGLDHGGVALQDGDLSLTGRELWHRATSLARLLRARGVERGVRVGVQMPRSADAVLAILAVLVASGSYVPLDPAQPAARRRRLAERAGCHLVLDSLPAPDADADADAPLALPAPDDEAYLLFTSGSTGEPKGVPITHLGLARYLRFATEHYPTAEPPVVALFSALTFDLTVTSLFLPLVTGGRMRVIRDDGPAGLAEVARSTDVTWCKATPSHLEILERLLPPDHRLATLVVGGEAFGTGLARRLQARRPGIRIFNEYGPTEAVVGCMIHEVAADPSHSGDRTGERSIEVPIGVPAPGVTLRVVDEHLERVPIGSPGELLIAHVGLTAGYLDADGPFVELDGRRFYRSGDLVRLADPATLVYLGRIDEQVKVGGIRLEPTEVEDTLAAHSAVERAAVRLWSPTPVAASAHCARCGLPSNVPGVRFDDAGVCDTCRLYERIAPVVASWFKTPDDLVQLRDEARATRRGDYDCLALLSGGKDSTYALHRLVDMGFHVYALTLDNGFISDQAKANIRRTIDHLGVDHEFATTEAMDAIFRDSLERHSNVCNGCFKTIYTVATNRAAELGIPAIVTGLSRGQLFETRLVPQQFAADRFDPEAIDRAVLEARRAYHRTDDAPNRLLDTEIFRTDDVFDQIRYVDFYRYVDVGLAEMLGYLDRNAPWVRPTDTGRSTNCRINDVGIHTHLIEQGYHNYAVPYAWDVRLGHKVRDEAIDELDDRLDPAEVGAMLRAVGYQPSPRQILTAWIELRAEALPPSPAELRAFVGQTLPAHAIPAAFVVVPELPLTTNGKLDTSSLPAPERVHRSSPAIYVSPESPLESTIVSVWESVLKIEPVGLDDDFFSLGGDSLAALEMIVALGERIGRTVSEELAFVHTTPRALAAAVELIRAEPAAPDASAAGPPAPAPLHTEPALSVGEQSILFDHQLHRGRPGSGERYNVGHVYRVAGDVDGDAFARALRQVAARHVPLSWSFASPRVPLSSEAAVAIEIASDRASAERLGAIAHDVHRAPFDLERGPLLRCRVQPLDDGSTAIVLSLHHVSGDAESFVQLLEQVDDAMAGREVAPFGTDHPTFAAWQLERSNEADRDHWMRHAVDGRVARLRVARPPIAGSDGFLRRVATVTPHSLRHGSGTSGFAAVVASLGAVLRRWSDGDRIGLGAIVSTRTHPAAAPLVGYLLNTVPLELDCPPEATCRELGVHAGAEVGRALAHRTYPLARIVADRRAAGLPMPSLDVLVAYSELSDGSLDGHRVTHDVLFNGTAVAEATFFVEVHDDRVDLAIEYRGSVLTADDARRLLDDVDTMLGAVTAAATTAIADVALPSGGTSTLRTPALTAGALVAGLLPDAIAANVAARGAAPAVTCGSATISWAELGRRADHLAGRLAAAGVGRGDRVLVDLPRSVDLVVAVVAALRAGAAYVPLDPAYPEARRRLVAELSGARFALVAPGATRITACDLVVDPLAPTPTAADAAPAAVSGAPVDADDPAYVIFTSGSTGTPRGVEVTHGRLAWSTDARAGVYSRHPGSFLLLSSIAFDSSVAGIFWTLAAGGELVLPTDAEAHDPDALLRLVDERAVTHTLMVPTLYAALLERGTDLARWPEVVAVAGEACPARLVTRHHELRPDSTLVNEYGPTEATVWATAHECAPDGGPVPIGRPVPGAWVRVVGPDGRERPAGVVGELVIGGPGVTGGYRTDADATARRFVDLDGDRVFRTGDLATVRDGVAWFLGRGDHQLNIGGVRAEPEEIERVLCSVAPVTAAVVTAHDPRSVEQLLAAASPGDLQVAMGTAALADDPAAALADALRATLPADLRLVAHLETDGDLTIDVDAVRAHVREVLPALVRPSVYVVHDALPRTPNGKIDREAVGALPHPASPTSHPDPMSDVSAEVARPVDVTGRSAVAVEVIVEQVRRQFRAVLGSDARAGDSFFDLGGHSLLALELVQRLERSTGARLTVATLYERPTPAAIAEFLAPHVGQQLDHQPDQQHARRPDPESTALPAGSLDDQYQFLVPVQPRGTRPPIFGVHVLGQNAAFYRPLAAELGSDQPVFGLGLAGALENATAPTDVADVSRRYADELERCVPTGPVVLAAVSVGSVAAVELANLLVARGRHVLVLALFDAAGPDADRFALSGAERLRVHAAELRRDPGSYLGRRLHKRRLVATRRLEQLEIQLRNSLHRPLPDRLRIRRFIEHNVQSALGYDLETYPGRITVFKAGDDAFTAHLVRHGMGWADVAADGVEVHTVPGGHLSMLEPPHVTRLGLELRSAIDRALDRPSASTTRGPRALDDVEGELRRALRSGRFTAAVHRLATAVAETSDTFDAEATALVDRADRTTRAIADSMVAEATRISAALTRAGIDHRIPPVAARLQLASTSVEVDGDPDAAIAALGSLGYELQDGFGAGAWRAWVQLHGSCTLIRRDAHTTRIHLRWGSDRPGGRLARIARPGRADLVAVDLPAVAWPAYWLVRPVRIATERLRGSRRDLGVFLGTPAGLAAPVLELAAPQTDDLVVDLGCGDGRVLVEAATRFGCRGRGVELDPTLVAIARANVAAAGLADRIEIVRGDATDPDVVRGATIAFAFLPPDTVTRLVEPVLAAMGAGSRFVTHEQLESSWTVEPTASRLVIGDGVTVAHLWLGGGTTAG